jgi:hypothetical protein
MLSSQNPTKGKTMKNETWTLPDGSEIRVKNEETTAIYHTGTDVFITTWDPETLRLVEEGRLPGESGEQAFIRLVHAGLKRIRQEESERLLPPPNWKGKNPDHWKNTDDGEG